MVVREQAPDPLHHQSNVHNFSVDNTKTTLVLRLANLIPIHSMLFAFVSNSFPKESTPMFIEAISRPICEQE
jgi:hypothetical protein